MNSEQFKAAKENVDTPFGRIHVAQAFEMRVARFIHGAGKVKRLFSAFVGSWQRLHVKRHINELPDYILKDIGWPDAYAKPFTRHGLASDTEAGRISGGNE